MTTSPMPERVLYLEPLRRRMSVELGRRVVARSDEEGQTFCPYNGLASYYDVGDVTSAAWSYRTPFEEVTRIADLVSFYPEKVTVTIDGEKLEPVPGQEVIAHGPDRNLSVDEMGGIQMVERAISAPPRA